MLVCTLGDLVLDVIVRLRQPLAADADTASQITLGPGGQAANVAAWVAWLGADARWLGRRADDDAGRLAATGLAAHGVELAGPVAATGTGVIVSLVADDGRRSMCSDRGGAATLEADEIDPGSLAGCDWLHVSGYALFSEPMRSTAGHATAAARAAGARVSVDLASWSGMRDAGIDSFRRALEHLEPDVVFANDDEARLFGSPPPESAWIVKHGAAGCTFAGEHRAAHPVDEVVDTTGAGDALAAGWLVGGADLALEAAARCVARAGAMPPPSRGRQPDDIRG